MDVEVPRIPFSRRRAHRFGRQAGRMRSATLAGAVAVLAACGSVAQPPSLDQRVRQFVTASYIHGVPYDEARALGPQAVGILIPLLDDPAMSASRSNIVVTLGILGSDQAEQRIRAFVEDGSGNLSTDDVSARLDGLTALGYAANVAATDATATYLADGLKTDVWVARARWRLPSGDDPVRRLRERTIAALGLSGKPDALRALQNVQASSPGLTPSEQALVTEAITANQYIAANGLSQYYRTFLRH